jgi:transcriptional regulator with XRE-family HTH domain
MAPVLRAHPLTIDSADALGIAVYLRRRSLKLTQQGVADRASLERGKISQLERGYGSVALFGAVLLIVNALGMDIELRPRDWTPHRSRSTRRYYERRGHWSQSGSTRGLQAVGISEVGQIGGASELVHRPEFRSGSELYEIVCALNRHGLSLPADGRQRVPGDREREIFRLRVVEGMTLPEVAERIGGIRSERMRQVLSFCSA